MRRIRPVVLAAIAVGTLAFTTGPIYTPTLTKFYMRNSGGATCPGSPFLSVEPGSGEPGCGYVGGLPFGELYHAGAPVASTIKTYTSSDGTPLYVDATRNVKGSNRIVATATTNRMAVGQIRVDVTVVGVSGGQTVTLGSSSSTQIVNPTNSAEVDFPFEINTADSLDKQRFTEIRVAVDIRGWHVLTGYHRLNGQSWMDLPTYKVETTSSEGPVGEGTDAV